jgi:tetratricopeptide (TPR) repeat protein
VATREVKEKAARLVAQGQFERAEVLYRQALTQAPRDASTWLKHAEVLKRLSRDGDAVASYRLAARIFDDEGHHPRAAAALKLALALLPDDVDLITDIIRSEMKTRRPGEAIRSVFPISSPSQLLAGVPAPMPSSPSAIARDAEGLQLALPPSTGVDDPPRSTTLQPATKAAPQAVDAASATGTSFELEVADPPTDAAEPIDAAELTDAAEGPPAADDRVASSTPEGAAPASPPAAELVVEVGETSDAWPQVRRLSAQAVAIRASATSRWIVVSGDLLEVRFLDDLDVPDDADWLE